MTSLKFHISNTDHTSHSSCPSSNVAPLQGFLPNGCQSHHPNMPENQKPQSLRGFLVRSDNPSLDAKDVTELAFIMIDMPQLKAGEDTEAASSALINGDPRSAHDRLLNTIHEADLCDEQFAGSSNPLPGFYKAVHDSGTVGSETMSTIKCNHIKNNVF
ncbi:hypothetical protein ACFXTO_012553 [Malus domestica]